MMEEERAGRLVAWGNALLAGRVAPDDAAEVVSGGEWHRIEVAPGGASAAAGGGDAGEHGLTWGLGRLRALGVCSLRLALPVPGHPLGLTGPPGFNALALEAGEAVIAELPVRARGVAGAGEEGWLGFVPEVSVPAAHPEADEETVRAATSVVWRCSAVRAGVPADVPSLPEAERELTEALREATEALQAMDLAGMGPRAEAGLAAMRRRAAARHGASRQGAGGQREVLAPGYPARAVRVLELAGRVGAVVEVAGAQGETGAAVSAAEVAARQGVLRRLEWMVRRARVAAYGAGVVG